MSSIKSVGTTAAFTLWNRVPVRGPDFGGAFEYGGGALTGAGILVAVVTAVPLSDVRRFLTTRFSPSSSLSDEDEDESDELSSSELESSELELDELTPDVSVTLESLLSLLGDAVLDVFFGLADSKLESSKKQCKDSIHEAYRSPNLNWNRQTKSWRRNLNKGYLCCSGGPGVSNAYHPR